jgi:hypothetical protein
MQKIEISSQKTIKTVKKEFAGCFRFLKIEFFSRSHQTGEGSQKKLMFSEDKTLGECRAHQYNGILTIHPEMTVADLEQKFDDVYGLSVQVFRRSGKVWLETIHSDSMTLIEQNKLGEVRTKVLDTLEG